MYGVSPETSSRDHGRAWRHGDEGAHGGDIGTQKRRVHQMLHGEDLWTRGHTSSELQESDDGAGKGDSTDENPEVCGRQVQSRDVTDVCHHAADTRQYRCQFNNGMKCGDCLRQVGRRDTSGDQTANETTHGSQTRELGQDFWGEADRAERDEESGTDAQYAKQIALSCRGLRSQA